MLAFFILLIFFDFSLAECPADTTPIPPSFGSKWPCLLFDFSVNQFTLAENECIQRNGHLVSIPNGFFDFFISRRLLKYS